MEIPKIQLYRKKKELWVLVFLVGLVAFFISPVSDSTPGFLFALSQGTGTELKGYKIHTGLKYIYHHYKYLGGVSLSKISLNFKGIENGYYLSFNEGAKKEIDKLTQLCTREISSCESISFDGYEGFVLSTYIESIDEIVNKTIYFNRSYSVYISHSGNPFDSKYIEVVERFFHDNRNQSNS